MVDVYDRIQIDVNGNIYPCYLFLEASGGKPWDLDMQSIRKMDNYVCRFCEVKVKKICQDMDLDYII
jgi:hypothetical protein